MTSLPGTAGKITGGVSDICGTSLVVSLASRSSAAVSSVIAGGGEDCSADSDTDAPMSVSTEMTLPLLLVRIISMPSLEDDLGRVFGLRTLVVVVVRPSSSSSSSPDSADSCLRV